jgi:hypothetical protein
MTFEMGPGLNSMVAAFFFVFFVLVIHVLVPVESVTVTADPPSKQSQLTPGHSAAIAPTQDSQATDGAAPPQYSQSQYCPLSIALFSQLRARVLRQFTPAHSAAAIAPVDVQAQYSVDKDATQYNQYSLGNQSQYPVPSTQCPVHLLLRLQVVLNMSLYQYSTVLQQLQPIQEYSTVLQQQLQPIQEYSTVLQQHLQYDLSNIRSLSRLKPIHIKGLLPYLKPFPAMALQEIYADMEGGGGGGGGGGGDGNSP